MASPDLGPDARWALLSARRTIPFGLGLALVLVYGLVALSWPRAETTGLDPDEAGALQRGLARAHAWSSVLLLLAPAVVVRTLQRVGAGHAAERRWLASTPLPRARFVLASYAGALAAAAAVVALAALAIELSVGAAGPTWRPVERVDHATFALTDEPRALAVGQTAGAARVGCDLRALGPGRITVELVARRGTAGRTLRRELGTHARLAIELPDGSGPVRLELRRVAGDATFVVPAGGIELARAVRSDRRAGLDLGARATLALAAWLGLAYGLGAWLSTPLAFALLASVQVACALADSPLAAWPGVDWAAALGRVARGELPPPLEPATAALSLALAAVGLALGSRSARGLA